MRRGLTVRRLTVRPRLPWWLQPAWRSLARFGIAAVEAISAGGYPLLPNRLSYPELLQRQKKEDRDHYFYAGDLSSLVTRLGELIEQVSQDDSTLKQDKILSQEMQRFGWSVRAPEMDLEIEALYHS